MGRSRTTFLAALVLLSLPAPGRCVAAQAPDGPREAIVAEVARLDSIWLNAYVTADVEAVRPIVADDFVGQIYQTVMGKDELLDRVATATGVEAMILENRVVNVYGDVAVVHARRRQISRDGDVRTESHFVYTDVYRYRDGRWVCITGQSAPVVEG